MNFKKYLGILHDEKIKDKAFVKEYLEFSFKYRKPFKSYSFYINICKIFNGYPKTIKKILDDIPKLGYYKDYFYILLFSRNEELNNYIYDILEKRIKRDIELNNKKEHYSTLAKWLPRYESKINRKTKFVDKFSSILFPGMTDVNNGRALYRKLKSKLNKGLSTVEIKLCNKEFKKINFDKMGPIAFKKYLNIFMNNQETRKNFKNFLVRKLQNVDEFIKYIKTNENKIEKSIFQEIWEENKNNFINNVPMLKAAQIDKSMCFVDLSRDTFKSSWKELGIGIMLLVHNSSNIKDKVIMCSGNKLINLNIIGNDIIEQYNNLLGYCSPCQDLNLNDMIDKAKGDPDAKSIIVVSGKPNVDNISYLKNKKLVMFQLGLRDTGYTIYFSNGSSLKTIKKDDENNNNIKKHNVIMNDIVNNSWEINEYMKRYLSYLFLFCMISGITYNVI